MKSANKTSAPVAAAGVVTVTAKHGRTADLQPSSLTPLRRGKRKSTPSKSDSNGSPIYRKYTKRNPDQCDRLYTKLKVKMGVFEQAGTDAYGIGDLCEDVQAWVSKSVFETTRKQGLSEEKHSLDHLELGLLAD